MSELHLGIFVVGLLILTLGLLSSPIRNHSFLSPSLIALALGAALGPAAFDTLDPARWGSREAILEEAAQLSLAIGLMGVALRLPPKHFRRQWRPVAALLAIVMPAMWLASSLIIYWLVQPPLALAFLIGAVITPTDPIVASSLVTAAVAKENLPDRIRHAISAESGANDGLAHLFVMLPILLMERSTGAALAHWLAWDLLWHVVLGGALGAALGLGGGWLLRLGEARGWVEHVSFLGYTVALALLTLGAARLLDTNAILAVFVAGLAFDNVVKAKERAEEAEIQETFDQFFTLPVFLLLGLALPVHDWAALGWRGAGIAACVLALRRLPAVMAASGLMRPLEGRRDALFVGWFGPIGVSAIYYAMFALQRTGEESIWTIVSLVICASIVAHGTTATPLTRLYGRGKGPSPAEPKAP